MGKKGGDTRLKKANGAYILEHSKKAKSIRAESFTWSAQKAQLMPPGNNS